MKSRSLQRLLRECWLAHRSRVMCHDCVHMLKMSENAFALAVVGGVDM